MRPISLTKNDQTEEDKLRQQKLSESGKIPAHIAIIMDGNGRWAKKNGNLRITGHKAGVDSVRDVTEACAQIGVHYLTLYAFSTENWLRPPKEVNALMKILVGSLRKEARNLNDNNIKLESIGQVNRLPEMCQKELKEVKSLTKNNTRLQLTLALSYSGRWDILNATKKICDEVRKGHLDTDNITEEMFGNYLATHDIPDPDLMIRTSGEHRLSNYLLWQLAYAEFYYTDDCWPEFRRNQLYKAIESFQNRERRFGKTSEQLNKAQKAGKPSVGHVV